MGEKEFSSRPGQYGALSSEAQTALMICLLTKEESTERNQVNSLNLRLASHGGLSQDVPLTTKYEPGVLFFSIFHSLVLNNQCLAQ